MKKILCIVLAAGLLLCSMVLAPVSAAAEDGQFVYFDAAKWGANVKTVYCHIWQRGGGSFFGWQSKAEACTKQTGSIWSYDLSKLDSSTYVEGGLKSDTDYCIIFCSDTGAQTYDQTFGTACIGDTAVITDNMLENAVDSEKKGYESVWTTNSYLYGPHLALTSVGNVVGTVLCPHESGAHVIGDWLPTYYESEYVDAVEALANALPKFGVKDINEVFNYIKSKKTDEDEDAMKKILEEAYARAYPDESRQTIDHTAKRAAKITAKSFTKTFGAKPFKLNAKTTSKGNLSYTSDNKKVAVVSSKGLVTLKGAGTAHITIKSSATSKYTAAKKKITIKVKLADIKSVTADADYYGKLYVVHTRIKGASGYNVRLSKSGTLIEKNVKSNGSFKLSGLKAGSWTLKIRPYAKTKGKTVVGKWKAVKFKVY